MFNVGDRVKHVGKTYNFDHLGVEVVSGTIVDVNDAPTGSGVLYSVTFLMIRKKTILCFSDEIERIP